MSELLEMVLIVLACPLVVPIIIEKQEEEQEKRQ